jgi:hypothetical protein
MEKRLFVGINGVGTMGYNMQNMSMQLPPTYHTLCENNFNMDHICKYICKNIKL